MDIKEQIGLRIKALRLQHGLSQEALALSCGLDRTYIASVEHGRRNVSVVTLQRFWRFFNLSPAQFFTAPEFDLGNSDHEPDSSPK